MRIHNFGLLWHVWNLIVSSMYGYDTVMCYEGNIIIEILAVKWGIIFACPLAALGVCMVEHHKTLKD